MKRYAVCITDDDGGTGEAVFTVKNKTEARARGLAVPDGKSLGVNKVELNRRGRAKSPSFFILRLANLPFFL